MANYRLSEAAAGDLEKLYETGLLDYGLRLADAYFDGLTERFDLIAENPGWGRDYQFINPGLRRYVYRAHSVYYQSGKAGIVIVRILGNKQDPARHL